MRRTDNCNIWENLCFDKKINDTFNKRPIYLFFVRKYVLSDSCQENAVSWNSSARVFYTHTHIYIHMFGKESYNKPRQCITKQRYHFVDKGTYNQSYGFSSSHVKMWELDDKEDWMLKNWCFQIVVMEKTLQSPLDSKEIKEDKTNQS